MKTIKKTNYMFSFAGHIGIILVILVMILIGATSCSKKPSPQPSSPNTVPNTPTVYTKWSGDWYSGGAGGDHMTLTEESTNSYSISNSYKWAAISACHATTQVTSTNIIMGTQFVCGTTGISFNDPNEDNSLDTLKMYYNNIIYYYTRQ
jgi:hypothetical protein